MFLSIELWKHWNLLNVVFFTFDCLQFNSRWLCSGDDLSEWIFIWFFFLLFFLFSLGWRSREMSIQTSMTMTILDVWLVTEVLDWICWREVGWCREMNENKKRILSVWKWLKFHFEFVTHFLSRFFFYWPTIQIFLFSTTFAALHCYQ